MAGARDPAGTPQRVHLGADAWALLAGALHGAPLPPPFRAQDGPALDAAMRAAAEHALRAAGLLAGDRASALDERHAAPRADDGAGVLEELRPDLRASLRAVADPTIVVDSSAGLGDVLRIAHHALRGDVAAGLVRSQRPVGADELELGPVELGALRAGDLPSELLRGFPVLDGDPGRVPIALPAAASAALARALANGPANLARAVIEARGLPPPLDALPAGLRCAACIDVTRAGGRFALVALRVADGWWQLSGPDEALALRPVGREELHAELAAALTAFGYR